MAQVQPQMSSHTDLSDTRFRDMYQGIEKDSTAYKLLASMGWKEGEGLGANKQGISVHVKAQKKFDTAGVGLKESSARAQDWTLDMCKFSGILKGLQEVVNTAAAATDDGGDADPPVKPKKTKKRKKASTADTEHGSSAADVARASAKAASPAPDAPKAADTIPSAHAARYAKRARNKLVKGYSQTDLAAILGQTALFGDMPAVAEISRQPEEVKAPRQAETAERPVTTPDSDWQERRAASTSLPASQPVKAPVTDTERGWWGSIFARGARMGTAGSGWDEEKAFGKKDGFSEQDQTDLYNSAQDGKTQGKQGLGVGSRPGQLKKRAWKGKKKTFESDGEGDAEEAVERADAAPAQPGCHDLNSDMLPGGAVIVWAKGIRPHWFEQRRAELQAAAPGGGEGEQEAGDPASGGETATLGQAGSSKLTDKQREKCLRVAAKMLQKGSGCVKLAAAVDKALASLRLDPQSDQQRLKKKIKAVLKKGDGWCIENGMMVPAACA